MDWKISRPKGTAGWAVNNPSVIYPSTTYFGQNEVREPEDATTYEVKAGPIIVDVIDMKTGQSVWRGLASGITNGNGFDREENKIRQAVNLIFEKYGYRADKY